MADHNSAIRGAFADLYDIFVDWPGRLSREMPGLLGRLASVDAKKVLDIGCGTGQHVRALLDEGFDACGADPSPDMIQQATAMIDASRLFTWALGDAPPPALLARAPWDAITCLGNVWPHVTEQQAATEAMTTLRQLLRPGGLLIIGMKALAVRRDAANPYLPLLKRQHEGRPIYFVRFIDFNATDRDNICDMHILIARGDADTPMTADVHDVRRLRIWSPPELCRAFESAGFTEVSISGSIADPAAPPTTEDVFVHARV